MLDRARRRKERTYRELLRQGRARLVVLALEVGGRWSEEARSFLRLLAQARARSALDILRRGTQQAFLSRWSALLSVAAQRAFALSLLELPHTWAIADGEPPDLGNVLADARWEEAPLPSRMPLR